MRAVIFDMDGVLFDSEPVYLDLLHRYLLEQGARIEKAQLHFVVGASSPGTYDEIARRCGGGIDPATIRAGMIERAEAAGIDYGGLLEPHAVPLLHRLRSRGVALALASSATQYFIDRALAAGDIGEFFDVVVSGEMFRESKPNPEIYLHTLGELGLAADEALVVEDSAYGIEAAVRAGMRVAAVRDRRFGIDQSAADFHIDGLDELWPIVEGTLCDVSTRTTDETTEEGTVLRP